jgi:adenine-specific DNA-methyltransferase
MSSKQRLELTWIGKENRPRLEPRILLEDPERSYHAKQRVSDKDIFDNRLIFGDNLLALKALEQEFAGKVKCVFIDPPYNTGSAFTHYDDGVEHSIWLSLMRDRLELLQSLVSDTGSIWVTIDDNELYHLKLLMDETFGRQNFVTTIIWQKLYTSKNSAKFFSGMHDYILIYAKNIEKWNLNQLPRGNKQDVAYKNPDSDPRGPWKATPLHARNYYSLGSYGVVSPTGKEFIPPPGRYWAISKDSFKKLDENGAIWWGKDKNGTPNKKSFLSEVKQGVTPSTIWFHDEAGHNAEAKNEINALSLSEDVFITPKPERLISRILQLSTLQGDLVLDSFAGSGTTGAVAQKMGRRWIMVELGDHCHTHIIPRLKKVLDGNDSGGVTEATGWKGGGGFRYFHLAPSLLEKDRFGNLIISKQYNAAMLAEAMCKVMGFNYAPSDELYWQQGRSTENDFLFVTTQTLTREQLAKLSDEVGENRSLLICCAAFRGKADAFPNLTIKKIPSAVLSKCEWGHDDYSLNVANLPKAAPPPDPIPPEVAQASTPKQARRRALAAQPDLFSSEQQGGAE